MNVCHRAQLIYTILVARSTLINRGQSLKDQLIILVSDRKRIRIWAGGLRDYTLSREGEHPIHCRFQTLREVLI